MNKIKAIDYTQLVATIGVVIGIGLVLFEIRENNSVALQQSVATNWTTWNEVYIAEMQPQFASTFAKAMENTEELTLSEKVILNSWLYAVTGAMHQDVNALSLHGLDELLAQYFDSLSGDIPLYFGNEFARNWLQENKYWMRPDIFDAIDRELESIPIGAGLEYFDRLGTVNRETPMNSRPTQN
jgi:hypothetical protein